MANDSPVRLTSGQKLPTFVVEPAACFLRYVSNQIEIIQMAELLTAVLIATAGFLVGVNAFIIVAHIVRRENISRELARVLSRYIWTLRLGGDDSHSNHHRRHA
jgi:hypothetical protein